MVGLPNAESRERILRTLLAKEKLDEGFDFKELATMTDGYTGSELKVRFYVPLPIFICSTKSCIWGKGASCSL